MWLIEKQGSGSDFIINSSKRLRPFHKVREIDPDWFYHQTSSLQLMNSSFYYGDTIEYYFIVEVESTNQKFELYRDNPFTYKIRDPRIIENIADHFSLDYMPTIPEGEDYEAWLITNMGRDVVNLDEYTCKLFYRLESSREFTEIEAQRISQGYKGIIPASRYPEGTRFYFYFVIQGNNGSTYNYGNAESPKTFRIDNSIR